MSHLHLVPTPPDHDDIVTGLAEEFRLLLLAGWTGDPIEMVLYALLVEAAFRAGWDASLEVRDGGDAGSA